MDAIDKLIETYSVEDFKEIADHGCQSGVCRKHIYYGDTIEFYEDYENEITEYIRDAYDTDFLVKLFNEAGADLDTYKNDVVWCFIEMVAFEISETNEIYALT